MSELQIFYFRVIATNHASFATHIKAPDLKTAEQFLAEYPEAVSWTHVDESEIPADVKAKLGEPHIAGHKPQK